MTEQTGPTAGLCVEVDGIARRMRSEGWDVVAKPGPELLPDSLSDFRPDLVARRGEEAVVVEVRSRRRPPDVDMVQLAERISELPGWRLNVVYLPGELAVADREQLLRWASSADALAGTAPEAALLLAWAAAEGALHRLAEARGVDTEQAGRLLAALAGLGIVEDDEHDQLRRAMETRNALAHGRQGPPADEHTVRRLGQLTRTLAQRSAAAA